MAPSPPATPRRPCSVRPHRCLTAIRNTRLLAAENYPWLPTLETLYLKFTEDYDFGWVPADVPQHLATAVGRLPAVGTLTLAAGAYDELLVRPLATVDSGALPQSLKLELLPMSTHGECNFSNGARLLLLLWLKEEAAKAVEGQAPAVKWEIRGLDRGRAPQYISEVTTKCLKEVKAAWAEVEGN